jgi:hypothetical protein
MGPAPDRAFAHPHTPLYGSRTGTPHTGREQPDPIFETGFVFRQSRPDIPAQKRPPSSLIDGYLDKNSCAPCQPAPCL